MFEFKPGQSAVEEITEARAIVEKMNDKPRIIYGRQQPAYVRARDAIGMPKQAPFPKTREFFQHAIP